jgi:hypothetical protein
MTTMTGPVTGKSQPPARLTMTPGRLIALMIGVPIALALIIGGALSLVSDIGTASFQVNRTIPLDHGRLVARANGSNLTVRQGGASGGAAQLTGTVQYSLVRPDFTVNDGIGFSLHCRFLFGNCGLNAVLDVPPGTALDLASGGGNVRVSGIQSAVTVTTGGGNLDIGAIRGNLDLNTSGGDVNGQLLLSREATLRTGGGNVTLTFSTVPANVAVSSSGGDITIVLPHGATRYAITANTAGGSYHAPVPSNDTAADKISVDSGGGNVSITEAS